MDCNTKWKNSSSLYKNEHSSTDLQSCLQMSSNSLCHALVLKIHSVVEIQKNRARVFPFCVTVHLLFSFLMQKTLKSFALKRKQEMDCNTKCKNSCSLYKNEHSSTDLQPCLQMSSNYLCHGLVLKIYSVAEIQF